MGKVHQAVEGQNEQYPGAPNGATEPGLDVIMARLWIIGVVVATVVAFESVTLTATEVSPNNREVSVPADVGTERLGHSYDDQGDDAYTYEPDQYHVLCLCLFR